MELEGQPAMMAMTAAVMKTSQSRRRWIEQASASVLCHVRSRTSQNLAGCNDAIISVIQVVFVVMLVRLADELH